MHKRRKSYLPMILMLTFSCVPGPTIVLARPPAQEQREQHQKKMAELNKKIDSLEQQKVDRQVEESQLLLEISNAQNQIQSLSRQQAAAKEALFQEYAARGEQEQETAIREAAQISNLERQISQSRGIVYYLSERIRFLEWQGFNPDELTLDRQKLHEETLRLNAMESQIQTQRVQAGTAAFVRQQQQDWERNADQQNLRNEISKQLEAETSRLHDLEKKYQHLQQVDVTQIDELAKAEQDYRDERDQFSE